MITLGGVELNRSIQWVDRFTTSTTVSSTRRFLAGNLQVLQAPTIEGTAITLRATTSQGWLSKAQVDMLRSISNTLGATYVLDFEGEIMTVVFDHSGGAAVDFSPLLFSPTHSSADYFYGSIHLLTV